MMTWATPAAPAYVGRHREPGRRVAPLARQLTAVQVECEALYTVLTHIGDGRTVDEAWALGEIEALDLRVARQLAGATS